MIQLLQSMGFELTVISRPTRRSLSGVANHFVVRQSKVSRLLKMIIARIISSFVSSGVLRDRTLAWQWNLSGPFLAASSRRVPYDLVVVEDLRLLPLGRKMRVSGGLLFDAREYYPRQYEDDFIWRLFEQPERLRICQTYLSLCDQVITVAEGLADEYRREFGIQPLVIRSVPEFVSAEPRQASRDSIRMVHHGIANPNRCLERMLDIVRNLDSRFELDLYLTGSPRYITKLRRYAQRIKNVQIKEPVPFEQIQKTLCAYDIGLYYLEPRGFNVTYNLPNKLFEFIQARLAVAIGPSPEMARIVRQYACGIVANEFSVAAMSAALNALDSASLNQLKLGSARAATELNFATEAGRLRDAIDELTIPRQA